MRSLQKLALLAIVTSSTAAFAAEICGNGLDDDADGLADEGCYPSLTTGVCESPLSCRDTGMVSPTTGSGRYQLPADISPKVPWGPGVGLRRFYTSMYAPAGGAPVWRKPLGERWQHTYMTWLDKSGSVPSSKIVLHTNRGQDVQATYLSSSGGWDNYQFQPGFYVHSFKQRQTSPNEYQLRMQSGEVLVYNSSGRLTEIWETFDGAQKVLLTYDGNGQVSTVTDASGTRRLLFAYASNKLEDVTFQINSGSWVNVSTVDYVYSSGNLTSVNIGGSLVQTNVYTSNYLTQIQDASGKLIVGFSYAAATAGQVVRADTPKGMLGFEYSSSRAACSGKTVVYFNRGTTGSCNVDADCGSGFLCGGKTASGSTGTCFRGARCLTTASPSEDVVTSVSALGPPSESCTGACATVTGYVWSSTSSSLDLQATQDAAGYYTSRTYTNGQPTAIAYGDVDTNASNTNQSRTEWRFYNDSNVPSKPTEIRRPSDLSTSASSCSSTVSTGCTRTHYFYNATHGRVTFITDVGTTRDASGALVERTYLRAFEYDAQGRLTKIHGPLTGSVDETEFVYHAFSGTGPERGFLKQFKVKKDATNYLISEAWDYDSWGNPTRLLDPDGSYTCVTFDAARGYLKKRTENMAGQTVCSSPNAADIVTEWERDSALRLTKLTKPDASCTFYEYDSRGRLQRTKRRDDCVSGSAGDKQEFVYDTEGLLLETQTYDASNTLTAKQALTYLDSRRLERVINPVDPTKWTGLNYDSRGLLSQVDEADTISITKFDRSGVPGQEGRVTSVSRGTTTVFDTWSRLYSWLGATIQVTDPESKATLTEHDDFGRLTKLTNPDQTNPNLYVYNAAHQLVTRVEGFGGGLQELTHDYTSDSLGRSLTTQFEPTCKSGTSPAEIQLVYDAPPGSCPSGFSCTRTNGRLAYSKSKLMCKNAFGTDNTIYRETHYRYDDAGRLVGEHILDGGGGAFQQSYVWNKNGDLVQTTTGLGTIIGYTYGSATSNSDSDLVTAVWRNSPATPVIDNVTWFPYGPLKTYNQQSTHGGNPLRTRYTRNLAYRVTGIYYEKQTGGTILQQMIRGEDGMGRTTSRDFNAITNGPTDSYFLYDTQDRLVCETTTLVSSCPTSGANLKNNHSLSFTPAGDWKQLLRPIPGSTDITNSFNSSGTAYGTKHQITSVDQPGGGSSLGITTVGYNAYGERSSENNLKLGHDQRTFSYDDRRNLTGVVGEYYFSGWNAYDWQASYDLHNRRVRKSLYLPTWGTMQSWYFYYDGAGRVAAAFDGNYQYDLIWLGDLPVAVSMWDILWGGIWDWYVFSDENNRPVSTWSWLTGSNSGLQWSISPDAWGMDTRLSLNYFQPLGIGGGWKDDEIAALHDNHVTVHRPGPILMGPRSYDPFFGDESRTYDPFSGHYLQTNVGSLSTTHSYEFSGSNPVASGKACPGCTEGTTVETIVIEGTAPASPGGEPGWIPTDIPGTNPCTRPECLIPGYDGPPGPLPPPDDDDDDDEEECEEDDPVEAAKKFGCTRAKCDVFCHGATVEKISIDVPYVHSSFGWACAAMKAAADARIRNNPAWSGCYKRHCKCEGYCSDTPPSNKGGGGGKCG